MHRVRLSGIDAPEKKQPFGLRAKQSLIELTAGKSVVVEASKRDRYGRLVGKVLVDGMDVNLLQVRKGMAWFYREYQKEQLVADRTRYAYAQNVAMKNGIGLWSEESPVPPWEFRKSKKLSDSKNLIKLRK